MLKKHYSGGKMVSGDDFYLEVINHELDEEHKVNEVFKEFSKKLGVKLSSFNNVSYLEQEDSEAHDALICIDDGKLKSHLLLKGRYRWRSRTRIFQDDEK